VEARAGIRWQGQEGSQFDFGVEGEVRLVESLAGEPETSGADRIETVEDVVLNFGGDFQY
jgi:hypothetical protein